MRRHTHHFITAVLAGVLLLSGWKTARAAATWARAPHAGERTGLATPRNTPVRADATSPLEDIARAERAIVFVYLPDCQVCHANMANWIDLVAETRDADVDLYAVAPAQAAQTGAARDYWAGLERHVRVITATPAAVHAAFGVGNTPATLVVRKGQVRGEILGALTPAGKAEVLRFAQGSPEREGRRVR